MGKFRLIVCCLLLVGGVSPSATSTGRLQGVVKDSEGAVISGVRILVHWDSSGKGVGFKGNVGIEKDFAIKTNAKGEFTADLPSGFYDVFVSAKAFAPDCRKVRIETSQVSNYEVKLRVDPLVTSKLGDSFSN